MQTSQTSFYENRRSWSDIYIPAMNQHAAELLQRNNLITPSFIIPTVHEDMREGIDMYCDWDRVRLSYRTRKYDHLDYWKEGFTLRRSGGERSELNKVLGGIHADYMLYAVASQDEPGSLHAGVLIDLKSVAAQIKMYPGILSSAIFQTNFVDLPYSAFSQGVVVGNFGEPANMELEVHH